MSSFTARVARDDPSPQPTPNEDVTRLRQHGTAVAGDHLYEEPALSRIRDEVPCPREPVAQAEVTAVPADQIRPGDYLPPQPALHGTRWQHAGFQVGTGHRDVRTDLPVISGAVALFDRAGSLRNIPRDAVVTVHRRNVPEERPAAAN